MAETEEHQVNILLYCLDDDAEDILHSTNISEGDRKMYVKVLKTLTNLVRCERMLLSKELI